MNILLFGATGMVGQGALRECLLADEVALVQTVGRSATAQQDPRLRQLVDADLFDCSAIEEQLTPFDACFFCIGVTSSGISEAQYTHWTHDLAMAVAETLVRLNPQMREEAGGLNDSARSCKRVARANEPGHGACRRLAASPARPRL